MYQIHRRMIKSYPKGDKMRIGIDIDDTIADSYEVVFAYAQKYTINELGRTGKIENCIAKHHSYVNAMHNWNTEEEMNFWHEYFGKIITQIKPFTFAVETIQKLKEEGHEIVLVTARWPEDNCNIEQITLDWLSKNHIEYNEIVLNARDKAKVAIDKKLDLFIDDSFQNCTEVANTGIQTYIMNTRTNQGLEAENIMRVYSWPDIYNKIKKSIK